MERHGTSMAHINDSRRRRRRAGLGLIRAMLLRPLSAALWFSKTPTWMPPLRNFGSYVRPLAAGTTKITAAFCLNGVGPANYPIMGICGYTRRWGR